MPTSDPAKTFVTPEELLAIADYLPEAGRALLEPLAARQAAALAAAPERTARQMLALVEAVGDYDKQAASHLLIGMLRIAAGTGPLTVEKTAMRIAGLAQLEGDQFTLTPEGLALVRSLIPGMDTAIGNEATPQAATVAAPRQIPVDTAAFAQLRFGEHVYEIADGPLEDMLCFRLRGQKDWTMLDRDRTAGWAEIGAEMLTRSSDVVQDYVTMHTVRLPDPDGTPDLHRFDLDSLCWWVRVTDGKAQFRLSLTADWIDLPDDPSAETVRNIGIRAARAHLPGFLETVQALANAWVRRMAHSAAVTPILAGAA